MKFKDHRFVSKNPSTAGRSDQSAQSRFFTILLFFLLFVFAVFALLDCAGAQLLLSAYSDPGALNATSDDDRAIGLDFAVFRRSKVLSIGFADAGLPGINGTLHAIVVNRVTRDIVLGPIAVNSTSGARAPGDAFLFIDVSSHPNSTLGRGLYSLVSYNFSRQMGGDRKLRFFPLPPRDVLDRPFMFTGVREYDRNNRANLMPFGNVLSVLDRDLGLGATLRFEPEVTGPLPPTAFGSCEAVKCASLPSGRYNVAGKLQFCENDLDGGGWLRLLRANETACEALGWTSSRNNRVSDESAGIGCRVAETSGSACSSARLTAPFLIRDVRGLNWDVLSLGDPDGFQQDRQFGPVTEQFRGRQADGVMLRVDGGPLLWIYAFGHADPPMGECMRCGGKLQCWVAVRNISGDFRAPSQLAKCGDSSAKFDFLQTAEKAYASRDLIVDLCVGEGTQNEDLLVRTGDILVRSTVNFTASAQQCANLSALAKMMETAAGIVPTSSDDASWIAPTVIASLLFILVVGLLVYMFIERRGRGTPSPPPPSPPQQQPAQPAPRTSQYASISGVFHAGAGASNEFESTRFDEYGASALSTLR
jgi:hypothetical protein